MILYSVIYRTKYLTCVYGLVFLNGFIYFFRTPSYIHALPLTHRLICKFFRNSTCILAQFVTEYMIENTDGIVCMAHVF